LPAKHVIHAVGPVWHGGSGKESELLASCYATAMRVAHELQLRSIAFPSISTGIHGFPVEPACKIAFDIVLDALQNMAQMEGVIFCTFSSGDFSIYQREYQSRKELAR
jgi:O-acetyl-ADP-ribose deacetylase (regulator of RNase III)